MREQIVNKLNSYEPFTLSSEEVNYVVRNWIQMHSQHHAIIELKFDPSDGVYATVEINKDSIYKI
jgi:hypothetical protein